MIKQAANRTNIALGDYMNILTNAQKALEKLDWSDIVITINNQKNQGEVT